MRLAVLTVAFFLLFASFCFSKDYEWKFIKLIEKKEGAPVKVLDLYATYRDFSLDVPFRILASRYNPIGAYSFLVEQKSKRFWVRIKYLIRRKVAVALTFIPRGNLITNGMIEEKSLWISPKRASRVVEKKEAVGKVAKRDFKKGNIILADYLAEPLLVRRGDLVKVFFRDKTIEIEAIAKALRNGKLGDVIILKNLSSGRLFSGEVVGFKEVMVR